MRDYVRFVLVILLFHDDGYFYFVFVCTNDIQTCPDVFLSWMDFSLCCSIYIYTYITIVHIDSLALFNCKYHYILCTCFIHLNHNRESQLSNSGVFDRLWGKIRSIFPWAFRKNHIFWRPIWFRWDRILSNSASKYWFLRIKQPDPTASSKILPEVLRRLVNLFGFLTLLLHLYPGSRTSDFYEINFLYDRWEIRWNLFFVRVNRIRIVDYDGWLDTRNISIEKWLSVDLWRCRRCSEHPKELFSTMPSCFTSQLFFSLSHVASYTSV